MIVFGKVGRWVSDARSRKCHDPSQVTSLARLTIGRPNLEVEKVICDGWMLDNVKYYHVKKKLLHVLPPITHGTANPRMQVSVRSAFQISGKTSEFIVVGNTTDNFNVTLGDKGKEINDVFSRTKPW